MGNKRKYWKENIDSLNMLDFNLDNEWSFILEFFDLKKFKKITKEILEKDENIYINFKLEDMFNWTFKKSPSEIKAILVIDKFYPWELERLSEIDSSLELDTSILIIPVFYYTGQIVNKMFHSFVTSIINNITETKNEKLILTCLLNCENFDFITNQRKLNTENLIIIQGNTLFSDDYLSENKSSIKVLNLLLQNTIINLS